MSEDRTVATQANEQGNPDSAAEVDGAQDWEALLDEQTEKVQSVKPSAETQTPDEMAALKAEVQALKDAEQQRAFESDLTQATDTVKSVLESSMDDAFLKDVITGRVSNNPKAMQVFTNRFENPDAWNKILVGLGKDLNTRFGSSPSTSADDVASVESAVRATSTALPDDTEPDISDLMSDPDLYNKEEAKLLKR